MSKKYSIGVDFGTLSARSLLVDVADGTEIATATLDYAHGVMDEVLPDGTRLPPDWALQHPQDYIDSLTYTVKEVLRLSQIDPKDVIGMSLDFTACTVLPVNAEGTPLCFLDEYKGNPHAYVKLWKHHSAQYLADKLNAIANERGETFLARYGGKISSEWLFPKIWQVLLEAEDVYNATDTFLEAGDWLTMWMTGVCVRNSTMAGYKAIWSKKEGYPDKAFFKALDPRLENVVAEKLKGEIHPIGSLAGRLTKQSAEALGLCEGTAVAVCNTDAHVAMAPAGRTEPGTMLMIMGTSTCDMILDTGEHIVPGMCGYSEDGIIPGLMGYEAGQSCVGDHFKWFVDNCVPYAYKQEADEKGMNLYQILTEKAKKLKPGESGLVALDWWNGNRSVLVNTSLTGLMFGMQLTTKAEEMYRALLEATAFGARVIAETFAQNGVTINEIVACGGIAKKDPFMMQIYADVLGREIRIARSSQTPALGSAMFGAVAAGKAAGGYDSIQEAAKTMGGTLDVVYQPIPENQAAYNELYALYLRVHDMFGRANTDIMSTLKDIKRRQMGI